MQEASNPARELIDEEFPEIYRPFVPAALKRAYASADQAIESIDFLGTPSAKFQRGDLIVLAAEFEFLRLIKEGHLPFDPAWENYASPTGQTFGDAVAMRQNHNQPSRLSSSETEMGAI